MSTVKRLPVNPKTPTQKIAAVDKQIDAIHRKICKLETFDEMMAEGWQSAWDKHPDLLAAEQELFHQRGQLQVERDKVYEVHEHSVLNSRFSPSPRIVHSHEGGDVPHNHPNTGPSFYGHGRRAPKFTKKLSGEQLEYIERSEEENSFELIVTDSAMINATTPIGNTPIEALGFPAAHRMMDGFRLICIVRDERKGMAR